MALIKYEKNRGNNGALRPYRFIEEVDRMFDDFLGSGRGTGLGAFGGDWTPSVDVEETKDAYRLHAELPGIRKEDVKISLADNVLTITGEKQAEKVSDDKTWHRVERSYGSFQRSFGLPTAVQADKVTATYKDGILTVQVPKSEEAKPREIEVKLA